MKNVIGVDVGVGSIKITCVSKNGNQLFLEALGETKNPAPGWIAEGIKGKGIGQVAAAIKMLLNDLKIRPKQAVTSLPEDEVVSRLIRLPPLKEDEVKEALKYEAETFVPYPLDQVSIDYEIVEKDESGRMAIFAIAAKNDAINMYVKLFKEAGLELIALESPAVAMKRSVNASLSTRAGVILVDMGEKYSDMVSMNNGNIYFTRSMSVGGESMTRAISVNLGLDMASAEEYKKAYGMREMELEGKIKASLLPVFSSMAEEIRRALVSFNEEMGKPVELLVLSGGGANMPGLAEELTKILGVEVQVIQPFIRIDTSKITLATNLATEGCRYSLSVGLALRGEV